MSDLAELYQAVIEDHRRRPRHRGPLPIAHRAARRENPACGDICMVQFQLAPPPHAGDHLPTETRIAAAGFTGAGCALSQASASLLAAGVTGLTLAEARTLAAAVETLIFTGNPPPNAPELNDVAALAAAHSFPARHTCALLAWRAALEALQADPSNAETTSKSPPPIDLGTGDA